MAEDDRPDDAPPGGKNEKPRRHPPVIELEATELGEDGGKAQPKPKPDSAAAPKSGQPEAERQAGSSFNLAALMPALIAGGIGAVAGAGVVFFGFPYFSQSGGSPDAALVREVSSLSARIETLSKRPGDQETAALGQRIDKLTAAIAEAEKRLAATEQRSETSPPPAPQPEPSTDAASRELREALAELRKIAGQSEQPAVTAAIESLSARIAALDGRVSSLATASKSSASSELAKEILALNALAAAINSGKPFLQELGAVRAATGPKASALEFLEQPAAKGISTVASLAGQFSVLAPKLLHKPESGGGFLSRLYSNATRLVEIRRIGEPQGDDPESVVTRIEALLARGDLAGAVSETAKLPDAAKSEAAPWIAEANKRRAAELAVRKLIDAALVAPEQSKS